MKKLIFAFFFLLGLSDISAQKSEIDSLNYQLSIVKHDTSRALILAELSYLYRNSNIDTSIVYAKKALDLAQKIKFTKAKIRALNVFGFYYRVKGDLPKALNYQNTALELAENSGDLYEIGFTCYLIGIIYLDLKDYNKAIEKYIIKALKIFEGLGNKERQMAVLLNLAVGHRLNNQPQLSINALGKAQVLINKTTSEETLAFYFSELGGTQFDLGYHNIGLENQKKAIKIYHHTNNLRRLSTVYNSISLGFDKLKLIDSCSFYAQKGLFSAESVDFKREILISAKILAKTFELKDPKKAFEYYKIAFKTNDELYGANKVIELQKIVFEEQEKQRKAEVEEINDKNRFRQFFFWIALFAVSVIGLIFYRSKLLKQKANIILENTLSQLTATQAQLIQSEKLASLGELTAGIAHEIQNPLNFVNNFSEVTTELIDELKSLLTPEGGIKSGEKIDMELFSDISENLEKISFHGKRASSIVKGMLEHSRTSTGVKELTDINAMADEYLRLAYHGLRAKDKNFNANFKTELDPDLPKIPVIPQDFGRVLLNLINNAFYAVSQKNSVETGHALSLQSNYKPTVIVSTQLADSQIIIKISDNGSGISDEVKAKIFQPFFTTKPTGEGTGLGLSLAYDIITKGHGGTIECESEVGEGTTFTISIPILN